MSFRRRSTIITFSARSFGLFNNSSLSRESSSADFPRGLVPLIGETEMVGLWTSDLGHWTLIFGFWTRKNLSGEMLTTVSFSRRMKAANGAGCDFRKRQKIFAADKFSGKRARICRVKLI